MKRFSLPLASPNDKALAESQVFGSPPPSPATESRSTLNAPRCKSDSGPGVGLLAREICIRARSGYVSEHFSQRFPLWAP